MLDISYNALWGFFGAVLSFITRNPFNSTKPPHMSMYEDIPRNVLAFRTITTLLAHLPQMSPFKPIDHLENQDWESQETREALKISDAFAQLAVTEHDIVAVSTNRGSDLGLMTCSGQEMAKDLPNTKPEEGTIVQKIIDKVLFLFARNNRPNDATTSSKTMFPTIIDPVMPADLGGRTAFTYIQELEERWARPSLSTHLWILTEILTDAAKHAEDKVFRNKLSQHLFRYTAAISCEKIKRRFTNQHLSRPFIKSLKEVTDIPIPSKFHPNSSTNSSGFSKGDRAEIVNDRRLLHDFVKVAGEKPTFFAPQIPSLIAKANHPRSHDEDFQLYDDETCTEFHQLLVQLLERFETILVKMTGLAKNAVDFHEQFKMCMCDAQMYAYALLRLSRGHAFKMHLENIAHLLMNHRNTDHIKIGVPIPGSTGEDEEEEADAELMDTQLVLPPDGDQQAAVKKSYVGWLRLMVAHFDAAEIVLRYITSPKKFSQKAIITKILVAPSMSMDLLPWRELLKSTELFPTLPEPTLPSTTTNIELTAFLEAEIAKAKEAKDFHSWAKTAQEGWKRRTTNWKYQQVCQALTKFTHSHRQDVDNILSTLALWNQTKMKKSLASEGLETKITTGIQSLYDKFGTMHCEAYLASLLDNFKKNAKTLGPMYENMPSMESFGAIIGVSKRCCPVCSQFLVELMKGTSGPPFIVRGAHSVVSACTLPPWTPSDIVDSMVGAFGVILRRDLVALKERMADSKGFNRNRSESTGSDVLSVTSSSSYGESFRQDFREVFESSSQDALEVPR